MDVVDGYRVGREELLLGGAQPAEERPQDVVEHWRVSRSDDGAELLRDLVEDLLLGRGGLERSGLESGRDGGAGLRFGDVGRHRGRGRGFQARGAVEIRAGPFPG